MAGKPIIDWRETLSPVIKKELARQWQALYKKIVILLRYICRVKLPKPDGGKFTIEQVDDLMKKAKVKFSWTVSTANDVLTQRVKIADPDDGQIFYDDSVGPEVGEVVLSVLLNEKQKVHAVVVANDGVNDSDPLVVDWTVPDLTKPAAPTNGSFAYEVVDVDEGDNSTN